MFLLLQEMKVNWVIFFSNIFKQDISSKYSCLSDSFFFFLFVDNSLQLISNIIDSEQLLDIILNSSMYIDKKRIVNIFNYKQLIDNIKNI